MKYATITALLFAAVGIQAAPTAANSELERRQVNTIYVRYYADGGCHGDWLEDYVFVEGEDATTCKNNSLTLTYGSIFYYPSTTTRALRVYNAPNCNETPGASNYYDIPASYAGGCKAGQFKSARFL